MPETNPTRVFGSGRHEKRWSLGDPCGKLLDHLLKVVQAGPEYIHPADIDRYAHWISDFRKHRFPQGPQSLKAQGLMVIDAPLESLGRALRSWVESFLVHPNPLMASFALDAASFIVMHATGEHRFGPAGTADWELLPLMNCDDRSMEAVCVSIHDPRLMKTITEHSGVRGAIVRGVVSPDGIIRERGKTSSALPGSNFLFAIRRCHLSRTEQDNHEWRHNGRYLAEDGRVFDIGEDFCFPGALLLRKGHPNIGQSTEGHLGEWLASSLDDVEVGGIALDIPARWLTHWIEVLNDGDSWREHPLRS